MGYDFKKQFQEMFFWEPTKLSHHMLVVMWFLQQEMKTIKTINRYPRSSAISVFSFCVPFFSAFSHLLLGEEQKTRGPKYWPTASRRLVPGPAKLIENRVGFIDKILKKKLNCWYFLFNACTVSRKLATYKLTSEKTSLHRISHSVTLDRFRTLHLISGVS